ncbi:MAG: hypothetical protein AMXMBFR64_12480 [Myxococcales bacterium]
MNYACDPAGVNHPRARQLRDRGRREPAASMKYFNTAGPCIVGMRYMLLPLPRITEAPGLGKKRTAPTQPARAGTPA